MPTIILRVFIFWRYCRRLKISTSFFLKKSPAVCTGIYDTKKDTKKRHTKREIKSRFLSKKNGFF